MSTSQAIYVFISYAHADEVAMKRLVADLRLHGITTWIDKSDIPPGTYDWENALRAAISKAHAVLLIASPEARNSPYVRNELRIAELYQRPVYPLWVAGTQWLEAIPLGWGATQYIDARGTRYESALRELVAVLSSQQSTPAQLPEPYFIPSAPSKPREEIPLAPPSYSTLRIFVSHSSKDDEFGVKLVRDLRREFNDADAVWYDAEGGLYGGNPWWNTIKKELRARPIFIVVLSPDALASPWVNDEINIAWRQKNSLQGKYIIPILYHRCEVPDDLDTLQVISFLEPKHYQTAFNELLMALRRYSETAH